MSENNTPLNDFLNMQEETPTMFGGFPFPAVTPEVVPTAPEPSVQQEVAQPAAAPTQGSLFQAAMAQTPAGQQPAPVPAQQAEAQSAPQPVLQLTPASNPAPEIANTKATNFPHPSIWDEQIDLPDPDELSSMTPAREKFTGQRRFFRLGAGV